MRFPGPAQPATTPVDWQSWTRPRSSVRFGGAARAATEPIAWEWSSKPDLEPIIPPPSPPQRAQPTASTPATPIPATEAAPDLPLPQPPTEILTALAHAQDASAQAHATWLDLDQRGLQTLAQGAEALTRILHARL